jgi:hypothetical protein
LNGDFGSERGGNFATRCSRSLNTRDLHYEGKNAKSFQHHNVGASRSYTLVFSRYASSEWEGFLVVRVGDHAMHWEVEEVEDEDGQIILSGRTGFETEQLWGDAFWYRIFASSLFQVGTAIFSFPAMR